MRLILEVAKSYSVPQPEMQPSSNQNGVESTQALSYQNPGFKIDDEGWLKIEFAKYCQYGVVDPWPYLCCGCLSPDHMRVVLEATRNRRNVPHPVKVPLCRECLAKWQRMQRRRANIFGASGLLLVVLGMFVVPAESLLLRFMISGMVGALVAIGHDLLLPSAKGPVQVRTVWRGQKFIQLRFLNARFVALICQDRSIVGG